MREELKKSLKQRTHPTRLADSLGVNKNLGYQLTTGSSKGNIYHLQYFKCKPNIPLKALGNLQAPPAELLVANRSARASNSVCLGRCEASQTYVAHEDHNTV